VSCIFVNRISRVVFCVNACQNSYSNIEQAAEEGSRDVRSLTRGCRVVEKAEIVWSPGSSQ